MSTTVASEANPEFDGFFTHAAAGHVAFPHCRACGRFHWYPMPRCPHCRSSDLAWRRVSGPATVFSFTRVLHPFDPSRAGALPYVVGLVTFADAPGVRLVTNIVGAGLDALRIGDTVTPVFRAETDGRTAVDFKRA
jgi:uncharacterized OB-fold protein